MVRHRHASPPLLLALPASPKGGALSFHKAPRLPSRRAPLRWWYGLALVLGRVPWVSPRPLPLTRRRPGLGVWTPGPSRRGSLRPVYRWAVPRGGGSRVRPRSSSVRVWYFRTPPFLGDSHTGAPIGAPIVVQFTYWHFGYLLCLWAACCPCCRSRSSLSLCFRAYSCCSARCISVAKCCDSVYLPLCVTVTSFA